MNKYLPGMLFSLFKCTHLQYIITRYFKPQNIRIEKKINIFYINDADDYFFNLKMLISQMPFRVHDTKSQTYYHYMYTGIKYNQADLTRIIRSESSNTAEVVRFLLTLQEYFYFVTTRGCIILYDSV